MTFLTDILMEAILVRPGLPLVGVAAEDLAPNFFLTAFFCLTTDLALADAA